MHMTKTALEHRYQHTASRSPTETYMNIEESNGFDGATY